MNHKDIVALRTTSVADLKTKLDGLQKDLVSFRLQKSMGQLGQSHLLCITRRDIARVKTQLRTTEKAES